MWSTLRSHPFTRMQEPLVRDTVATVMPNDLERLIKAIVQIVPELAMGLGDM